MTIEQSPCAGPPLVPAVLANDPKPAITVMPSQAPTDAIRIAACTIGSCTFDAKTLQSRALACCAVAQIVGRYRPVILEAFVAVACDNDSNAVCYKWPVSSAPMSMAEAGVVFGAMTLSRGVIFNHATTHHDFVSQWPWAGTHGTGEPKGTRDAYKPRRHDLVLGGMIATDPASADPVKWVAEQVTKLTSPNYTEEEFGLVEGEMR